MDKYYPGEFAQIAKMPGVIKVKVADIEATGPNDCTNCGGMGIMAITTFEKGPFETPAPSYGNLSSFWDDETQGWYVGSTKTAKCPICNGSAKKSRTYQPTSHFPTVRAIQQNFPSQRTTKIINKETGEVEILE